MTTSDCYLCGQIEGCKEKDLIAQLLPGEPYIRRVMMESGSFIVMPSLGPLVRGHSLLCPKAHIRSFASLDDGLYAEYLEVKVRLKERLQELYGGQLVLFEHGMSAGGDRTLCTVEHAHLHFLPLPNDCLSFVPNDEQWVEFDGTIATLRRLSQGFEYICYETPDGVCWLLIAGGEELESQYMRRVIAKRLGRSMHWNWRDAPNPTAAHEAWWRFVRYFDGDGA